MPNTTILLTFIAACMLTPPQAAPGSASESPPGDAAVTAAPGRIQVETRPAAAAAAPTMPTDPDPPFVAASKRAQVAPTAPDGTPAAVPGPDREAPAAPSPAAPASVAQPAAAPDLGPLTSPDVGDHCADDLDADGLSNFFADRIGDFGGADYQRALRLADDRVLWTFQDAFIGGALVHNVGMIQSGHCFSLLTTGRGSWLFDAETVLMERFHWILGATLGADGADIHLFVVEMHETGDRYLSRTRPVALRRVVLDAATLHVIAEHDEPMPSGQLYGWSVTSDPDHTYLYSHCYQQFGYDTPMGFGECVSDVMVARVPRGELDSARQYWAGSGWSRDARASVPIVDGALFGSGNNPAQIRFDGRRFVLVEKRDDWWGGTIEFAVSDEAYGPFRPTASLAEPLRCERAICNTYFATWVPWTVDGAGVWAISHNRWNGAETAGHLADYRPTFWSIDV